MRPQRQWVQAPLRNFYRKEELRNIRKVKEFCCFKVSKR